MDTTTAVQHTEAELKPLGVVRVECPYPVLAFALKEMLKGEAYVYEGRKPRGAQDPSSVILWSNGRDVASGVRRIRTFIPDAAILVFALRGDPQLAAKALRAGASGFIHAGMRPEEIVRAIRLASAGEIVVSHTTVSKELLENVVSENPPDLDALTPASARSWSWSPKG